MQRSQIRADLAQFLRTRRARVSPEDVGLANGGRRRTPGLRREELAQLAGISVTWYTWLEQGRRIRVSERSLDGLARALRLDATERRHLFALAEQPAAGLTSVDHEVSPQVHHVLEAITAPAYIINARWDVLAWNPAAVNVFGNFGAVPAEQRNLLWLVFADPSYRRLLVDWEADAPRVMAKFRISFARAGGLGNPQFNRLVRELAAASPEFRLWWERHDVCGPAEGVKRLRISGDDQVQMHHTSFWLGEAADLKLVVYTPELRGG